MKATFQFFVPLSLCVLFLFPQIVKAQQTYNHIQYQKLKWSALHTSSVHVYYPKGCDSLGMFIVNNFAEASAKVKKNMGTGLQQTPNIIIYPSTTALYESNIGASEIKDLTLPTFITKGNRILLAYNGSYEQLGNQLREGLARSIWEAQLNGTGIEEQATGATKEAVPYWFKEGTIRYLSNGWQVHDEDALRQSFTDNHFGSWEQVIGKHQALAGQAFCYFLTEEYLPTAVMQTYFQLRKRKPLPTALRLITKRRIDSLYHQCYNYYEKRFHIDGNNSVKTEPQQAIPHKKGTVKQVLPNPQGQYIAYILSTPFKRTVYCYNLKDQSTNQLYHYTLPPWIMDHSNNPYPVMSWSVNSKELLITTIEKGKIVVKQYSPQGSFIDKTTLNGADGIHTLQQLQDKNLLLSAWRNGQSDIVIYNDRKDKYQPITSDIYDDANPAITSDGYYFTSNRPDSNRTKKRNNPNGKDTLVNAQGIYKISGKSILPVYTDTVPYIYFDNPTVLNDGRLLYSSTKNGTKQLFRDSSIVKSEWLSNNATTIQGTERSIIWTATKDSLFISQHAIIDTSINGVMQQPSPWLIDYNNRAVARAKEDSILKAAKAADKPSFLDGVLKAANKQDSTKKDKEEKPQATPYVLQLYSAYFSAQVNNDYYMNRYQPYLNYQGQFKFPEIGGMAQGGFSDLFENHHFTVAFRIPAATEGSMFFFRYNNTKQKLDWGLAYYRSVDQLKPDPSRNWVDEDGRPYPNQAKVKTHYYEVSLSYPLSYYSKIGFSTAIRQDQTIFLATEKYSLTYPDIKSLWSINTLSYEITKLRPTIPNLYKGFKVKASIDLFKGFSQKEVALTGNTIQLSYHQPLYKYITLVTRLQGGYSGGDNKVLYTLGGVDNNVAPKVDSNKHFAQNAPYAFTTLVTPFRGYYQNSVYGNEYLLFNADVYFPIFQTLIPIETPLTFINNLQLGVFTDIATAKETWNNQSQGWKTAYGMSARTTLAGYPISVQVGWPGTFSKEPVWYLGLSLK